MTAPKMGAAIAGAAALASSAAMAGPIPATTATTSYHRTNIDGIKLFYREAGPRKAPTIVLLHGFPSSSRGFNTLIPLLATRYHLIAPDLPGFGQSDAPPPSRWAYSFDQMAQITDHLLEALKIERYPRVQVQLGRAGGNAGLAVASHPVRGERQGGMKVKGTGAVDAGLDDHAATAPALARLVISPTMPRLVRPAIFF